MEISILNCGVGNLNSIKNSLNYLKIRNKFVNTKKQIKSCNSIILPGVGSFFQAIKNIKKYDLYDSILEHAIGKPIQFVLECNYYFPSQMKFKEKVDLD